MGLETQAIIPGHVTVEHICELLTDALPGSRPIARAMHRPEYKIIEFVNAQGQMQALNVFLQSYAADDYRAVYAEPSTLLTLEFSPAGYEMLKAVAGKAGGFVQRTAEEPWAKIAA